MTIVFDVDGTLIGGEEQDWPSFDNAIIDAFDIKLDLEFWKSLEEVTGKSILLKVAEVTGKTLTEDLEMSVRKQYVANLRKAAPYKGSVFQPKAGAVEILQLLRNSPIFGIAIATGDFKESSLFKIASAELDIKGIPYASASDEGLRKDIIKTAIERAGGDLDESVYIGDGPWDLRACKQLDIPFIGTGRKLERLRDAGAEYIAEDLSPSTLLPILSEIMG